MKHSSIIYCSEEIIIRNTREGGLHYSAMMAGDQHISFAELWSTLKNLCLEQFSLWNSSTD